MKTTLWNSASLLLCQKIFWSHKIITRSSLRFFWTYIYYFSIQTWDPKVLSRVVSSDLFWVSLSLFCTMEYISKRERAPKLFFYTQTQCSFVSHTHICKMCLALLFFFAQRERVKFLISIQWYLIDRMSSSQCQKHNNWSKVGESNGLWSNVERSSNIVPLFWLTMTSQTESIRSTQYTPLYKNKQFESRITQWGLLAGNQVPLCSLASCLVLVPVKASVSTAQVFLKFHIFYWNFYFEMKFI